MYKWNAILERHFSEYPLPEKALDLPLLVFLAPQPPDSVFFVAEEAICTKQQNHKRKDTGNKTEKNISKKNTHSGSFWGFPPTESLSSFAALKISA
jgi:hypothetical protein